jgi:hypothetical protein
MYKPSSHNNLVDNFIRAKVVVLLSNANFADFTVCDVRLVVLRKDVKICTTVWERQDSNLRGF